MSVELQVETILFAPSVLKAETCSYPASKLFPTSLPTLIVPKCPILSCQNVSLPCDNLYYATIYINTCLSHQKQEREDSVKNSIYYPNTWQRTYHNHISRFQNSWKLLLIILGKVASEYQVSTNTPQFCQYSITSLTKPELYQSP